MILIFMIESFLTFLKMLLSKRNRDECTVEQTSPKGTGGASVSEVVELLLMPHRPDDHIVSVQTLASHVTTVAKIDDPVTELIAHVLDWPTHTRLKRKHFHALTNGRHRPFGCILIS